MDIKEEYDLLKPILKSRLDDFKNIQKKEYLNELIFCILTPQSKAQSCWQAVELIKELKEKNETNIKEILKTKTRFHNTKTKRVLEAIKNWPEIKMNFSHQNILELRNWLAKNVNGIGMKEASHFLRNIGRSNNQIAILDRHILKNLNVEKIKSSKHYLEIEQVFLDKAKELKILVPELFKQEEFSLEMEFIEGDRLSEKLNSYTEKKQFNVLKKIGAEVAKLHQNDIIHGDLTTSNTILKKEDVYIIDFGLGFISKRIEDKAVDLHLIKQALEAKHFQNYEKLFENFLESYSKDHKEAKQILERFKKVEARGRNKH